LRKRLSGTPAQVGVYLASQYHEVIDNHFEYTQNGIRVRNGVGGPQRDSKPTFVIARNVVYRTLSDGINTISNAGGGRIVCNIVRENGDDMISVLNYGVGEPGNVGNILIEANDLAANYWGRGIALHGGRDVTIRNNSIARVGNAAIFIRGGPDTYKMANVRNVVIEANTITDVETTTPPLNPVKDWKPGRLAAIDISGPGEVSDILVKNNVVSSTAGDGIRVYGNAMRVGLEGNRFSKIGRAPIKIDSPNGSVACSGNERDNNSVSDALCGGDMPAVKGAAM